MLNISNSKSKMTQQQIACSRHQRPLGGRNFVEAMTTTATILLVCMKYLRRLLMRQISSSGQKISEAGERLRFIAAALKQTPEVRAEHFAKFNELKEELTGLQMRLWGDPIRQDFSESTLPSIWGRVGHIIYGHWSTSQAPTKTYQNNLEIATRDFAQFGADLRTYLQALEEYEAALEAAGAPYTRGRKF
mgnify:CR=1 FL=1